MEMILLLGNVDSLYGHQSFRSRALAANAGVAMPKEAARKVRYLDHSHEVIPATSAY
jgi:hypothetical protein